MNRKICISSALLCVLCIVSICGSYIYGMIYWGEEIKDEKKISLSQTEDYLLDRGICDTSVFNNSIIIDFEGMDCNSDRCKNLLGGRVARRCKGPFRPEDYRCLEVRVIHQDLPLRIYLDECFAEIDMEQILTNKDPTDNTGFEITLVLTIIPLGACFIGALCVIFVRLIGNESDPVC